MKTGFLEYDIKEVKDNYEPICVVKVKDEKNNRFTDVSIYLAKKRGRIKVLFQHLKGYPSENKGLLEKEMTLNWISNELSKID